MDSDSIREEIARLAYSLWQARNGRGGSAESDWLHAERVVLNRLNAG